jgi:hypothetical protein
VKDCVACGFVYDEGLAPAAGRSIIACADVISSLLEGANGRAATRRSPETWSPLEYACHVRDVLLVQRERVLLARRVEEPDLPPMGREERVEHDGYAEQDPTDVARQLRDAALLFDGVLSRLDPSDWDRTLTYNWPEPGVRSLRWVAVHTLHEAAHHLGDIRNQLPQS